MSRLARTLTAIQLLPEAEEKRKRPPRMYWRAFLFVFQMPAEPMNLHHSARFDRSR
jgi:hypothetical protein